LKCFLFFFISLNLINLISFNLKIIILSQVSFIVTFIFAITRCKSSIATFISIRLITYGYITCTSKNRPMNRSTIYWVLHIMLVVNFHFIKRKKKVIAIFLMCIQTLIKFKWSKSSKSFIFCIFKIFSLWSHNSWNLLFSKPFSSVSNIF
jgi:hypothetical protein